MNLADNSKLYYQQGVTLDEKRKTILRLTGIIMSLLIILMATPVGAVTTDSPESVSKIAVSNEIVSSGNIAGARVIADEGDSLYTTVVDNGNGTRTMTLHGYPVKYINDSGKIQDISLEITNTTEGAYKTKANSVQTVFPKTLSEGISLSNDDVSIKLKPRVSTVSSGAALSKSISEQISADFSVTKIDNKTVSYYYDSKTTLQYSLTYTGFKEDIVVSEYTGQTEYQFLLETGGLTLTKVDGSYYLTDGSGEIKATLGDIIIFTADEKNNTLGSMTHITVKENEQYILTIHVDASWLRDKNTAYPIRIDPTIEVTYDNNGASAIQDVTINSTAGSSGSSGSIYVGKRATYGISRTLMKFPGLNLSNISSANLITSAYVQIRDILCQTTNMAVCGYIFSGNSWSESTANWSNVNANAWTEMPDAIVNVNYSNGASKNPVHRYSINITQAVRGWKSGFYSQSTGIMLRAGDDVEYGSGELYKTFASYNRASNKPSLVVNYYGSDAVLLGIPDTSSAHDHASVFSTIAPYLQSCGLTSELRCGNTYAPSVQLYLNDDQNSVFVSRSHGGYSSQTQNGVEVVTKTAIVLNSETNETLSSTDISSSLDLSNLKLVVFCACETARGGEGANNLPSKVVQLGADTAIGFTEKINCSDANRWTNLFFENLARGYSVQTACNLVKNDVGSWNNKTTIDSVVICGNKLTSF